MAFALENTCMQMVLNQEPTDTELDALQELFNVVITKLAERTYRVEMEPGWDLRGDLCDDLCNALNDMRDPIPD